MPTLPLLAAVTHFRLPAAAYPRLLTTTCDLLCLQPPSDLSQDRSGVPLRLQCLARLSDLGQANVAQNSLAR